MLRLKAFLSELSMSIEIRQLVIKSNVLQPAFGEEEAEVAGENLHALKQDLLDECKRMVVDLLRERGER